MPSITGIRTGPWASRLVFIGAFVGVPAANADTDKAITSNMQVGFQLPALCWSDSGKRRCTWALLAKHFLALTLGLERLAKATLGRLSNEIREVSKRSRFLLISGFGLDVSLTPL